MFYLHQNVDRRVGTEVTTNTGTGLTPGGRMGHWQTQKPIGLDLDKGDGCRTVFLTLQNQVFFFFFNHIILLHPVVLSNLLLHHTGSFQQKQTVSDTPLQISLGSLCRTSLTSTTEPSHTDTHICTAILVRTLIGIMRSLAHKPNHPN